MPTELPLSTRILCTLLMAIIAVMSRASQYGVMDEAYITISEGDVIIFPLEMFYRPLVQVVDISERPVPCFSGIVVSSAPRPSSKVRFIEDCPNLVWGLHFWSVILRSRPPIIDIVL